MPAGQGDADSNDALEPRLAASSDDEVWHECQHTLSRTSTGGGGALHERSSSLGSLDDGERSLEGSAASTSGR